MSKRASDIGVKIAAARTKRGVTQAELALRIGVAAARMCRIERGFNVPSFALVEAIAASLDMTVGDLVSGKGSRDRNREVLPKPSSAESLVPVIQEDITEADWERLLAFERRMDALEASLGRSFPTVLPTSLRYVDAGAAAEPLAEDIRHALGLGMLSASGLPELLEYSGVRLCELDLGPGNRNTPFWNSGRRGYTMVVNTADTPERQLYRLAYDLGAICAFSSRGCVPFVDDGADHRFLRDFASSFLMPARSVRYVVAMCGIPPKGWSLPTLFELKSQFGVSAESFALRLESLGLIVPAHRQKFREHLRAYYKDHPHDMEPAPRLEALRFNTRAKVLSEAQKKARK